MSTEASKLTELVEFFIQKVDINTVSCKSHTVNWGDFAQEPKINFHINRSLNKQQEQKHTSHQVILGIICLIGYHNNNKKYMLTSLYN